MRVKNVFWLVVLSAFVAAQNNETLNVFGSVGFGFPSGGKLFSSFKTDFAPGGVDTTEEKDSYFNFGRGLKLDLGVQYFLMPNIALQAGIGISGNVPRLKTFQETPIREINTTFRSSLWGLKALIVPHFEVLELITMYTGVGIGFFWNSWKYEQKSTTQIDNVSVTETIEGKIKTTPKLGFLGLAGANFPLSDLLTLYGELAFEQLSFTTKKNVQGNNTVVYEKNSNLPAPERIPGSNWQLRFGVKMSVL